jgi:hypothetical protein
MDPIFRTPNNVLGVTFNARSDFERPLFVPVACRLDANDANDALLALRKRPGLVEHHRV